MACFAGTLTVEVPFDDSQVGIDDCNVSPQNIQPSGSATVEALVVNNNQSSASVNANVLVDGSFGNQTLSGTIPAGGSRWLSASITGLSQGQHNIEVELSSVSPA